MKRGFLLIFGSFILILFMFLCQACGGEEEDDGGQTANIQCSNNANCARDSYCDLENPQMDPVLQTLVYYCRKRQICSSQAECPVGWKCLMSENFCITKEEASQVLCSSNSDCISLGYNAECNRATGECYIPGQEGDTAPDSGDTVPDSGGDTMPDTGDSIPDTGDSVPDTGDSVPDTGDSVPDTGDSVPDTGDSVPDTGDTGDTDAGYKNITFFTDDFENPANWKIAIAADSANPCWQLGLPTSGPEVAYSGSKVIATNLAGNYNDNCNDIIYFVNQENASPLLYIPNSPVVRVEFYAWVSIVGSLNSPLDYAELLIMPEDSIWGAQSGVKLVAEGTASTNSALDSTGTKLTQQLGTAYYKFTGDISGYKGQKVQLGFRFVSDSSENDFGIYIDSLKLSY